MPGVLMVTHGGSGGGGGGGLSAVLNRTGLIGRGTAPGTVQTGLNVTCTPIGGTPPYTYLWIESGGPTDIYAGGSPPNIVNFAAYFAAPGSISSTFYCSVIDSLGASAVSPDVFVTLEAT